ncbi:hypothetical protein GOP47_0013076 [Adiantum capillus-veneris]|uniref:Pentatricopeptide repeat-containing protein n=1 Tax=Adiantum capillus-veneris TaxID=13818 RepID=A0A9D4ZH53_ADICA|nr:hypothetical protein GOP47_0013076 [Adiantum capillus-veneris]
MQRSGSLPPCGHTYVAQLKACAKFQDIEGALYLHAEVAALGLLESNPFVGSTLVDLYVKCGALSKAIQIFSKLSIRDVVSWTAIISGYAEHGYGEQVFDCFVQMQMEGIHPNCVTFVCCLKACGCIQDPKFGQQIHIEIDRQGLTEINPILGNSLIDMYMKCGLLSIAKEVFDRLLVKDVVSWTMLITGYAEQGYSEETLELYKQMKHEGLPSDRVMLVCCLKAFGNIGALDKGCELHAEIESKGLLGRDITVGNVLVDMYAKCGLLLKAQKVFDMLPVRNAVSWNVMMAGYGKCGNGQEALDCLVLMELEGVPSNALTLMYSLKACGEVCDLDRCQEIHSVIEKKGFLKGESPLGSTLVDVYAKCDCLTSAQSVFDKLPTRDVFSWTALIAGYAEQGHGERALMLFEKMQLESLSPTAVTYVCAMKVCGSLGAINKGKHLHMDIVLRGQLEQELAIGNALVDMYAKCSCLAMAQHVFNKLPSQNVVSWAALVSGYIDNGYGKGALDCLEQMLNEGVSHNIVTYTYCLQACGMTRDIWKGFEVHSEVERQGLIERDSKIGNTIVDMYAKCGMLSKAQESFNRLRAPKVLSWNALIAGYYKHGASEEAFDCFESMRQKGVSPNATTYAYYLEACGNKGALYTGQEAHNEVEMRGLLDGDLLLASALVDMYAKCGQLAMAHQVFNKLRIVDVVTWTALIAGYVGHDYSREALTCFSQMELEGVLPNSLTLLWCMKACTKLRDIERGQLLHTEIERQALLEKNIVLGNVVLDFYVKCGSLAKAQEVFERLPARDAVSWTALLAGYVEQGHNEKAIMLFDKMQAMSVVPTAITFVCILKACGTLRDIGRGKQLHSEMERQKLLEINPAVGNSLVNMYAKCGWLVKAQQVFDLLPVHNAVSWTTLIAGYGEHGSADEALECFEQMQCNGISPNPATFVHILKACSRFGAKEKGYAIHSQIERHGLFESNVWVGNALINAYANFGWFAKAQNLLYRLPTHDVVSWNTLMAGYAQLGQSEKVFDCFGKMQEEQIKPDMVTFNVVLKACVCETLAHESQTYFETMSRDYGIIPTLEHYVYVIDVLGRAGQLDKAEALIQEVQSSHSFVWQTLLCASRNWGSLRLGKYAFRYSVSLDESAANHHWPMHSNSANSDWMHELDNKRRVWIDTWKKPSEYSVWAGSSLRSNTSIGRSTRTSFDSILESSFNLSMMGDESSLLSLPRYFSVNLGICFSVTLHN